MTQKSSGPRSKGKIDNQIAHAFRGVGACQASVYEALAECDYQPDWFALFRPVLATPEIDR